MDNVKFKVNIAGFSELRKSPEVMALCQQYGEERASEADALDGVPGGYEANTIAGKTRAVTHIVTTSYKAHFKNLKHKTLLKVISHD